MDFVITSEYDERPLKDFLKGYLHMSTALLSRLKNDDRGLVVNGDRVTVRCILRKGDKVSICDFPEGNNTYIEPVRLEINIAYEDEYLIVADKPPFMPTHPSHDHHYDTLANALAWREKGSTHPFVFRPVSRLDRNTSGLVTVAKTKYVSSILNDMMKDGKFRKTYIAVTDGVPEKSEGIIDTGLRRTEQSIIVRETCPIGAPRSEEAITEYKIIKTDKDSTHSLVLVKPVTGKTHQIRVHFAYMGTPVCGDGLYGQKSELINRHALHAAAIEFPHPITKETMHISSPLPDDMTKMCGLLFGRQTE